MAIIIVGGSGRGVGKTALVCGLIAALPEFRWTVVKITSHEHGKNQPVWEETAAGPETDTGRYLAAGAERAFVLTATEGDPGMENGLAAVLSQLRGKLDSKANLIFESNRILKLVTPDLCLMVAGGGPAKPSFEEFAQCADAFAARTGVKLDPGEEVLGKAQFFPVEEPGHPSPEMLAWVRRRLSALGF